MAFSSGAVANELLRLAQKNKDQITPKKLQKLACYDFDWKGNPPMGTGIPMKKIEAHYKEMSKKTD